MLRMAHSSTAPRALHTGTWIDKNEMTAQSALSTETCNPQRFCGRQRRGARVRVCMYEDRMRACSSNDPIRFLVGKRQDESHPSLLGSIPRITLGAFIQADYFLVARYTMVTSPVNNTGSIRHKTRCVSSHAGGLVFCCIWTNETCRHVASDEDDRKAIERLPLPDS